MSLEIAFVLALMAVGLVLLSLESLSVDVVALLILVALLSFGVLTPQEALAGFGSEPVVAIGGLFVLTAALRSTGALDGVGLQLSRTLRHRPRTALALLLLLVALVSGFINNTTCTAAFLPVAVALARQGGIAPSRILMQVAFASILGGTLTLIGTSTNLIVSGFLVHSGQPPLAMFELLPVGLPLAVLGLAYLVLAAPSLLPDRGEAELAGDYHVREYLTEVTLLPGSPLEGRTVAAADLGRARDLHLLAIVRGGRQLEPVPSEVLAAGDLLLVEGAVERLLELRSSLGLEIHSARQGQEQLGSGELHLAESIVLPRSELVGRSLREARFRQRYGVNVIALKRHGEAVVEKVGHVVLRVGDLLLLQGRTEVIGRILQRNGLMLLSSRPAQRRRTGSAPVAVAVFAATVLLAATGTLPLPAAVLLGVLLLLLTRCLTSQEAYVAVDWRMLVLIAGMLGYGRAMEKTGAAAYLADGALHLVGDATPLALLTAFYLLTVLLTQPMSNQAAALVVLPVALGVAAEAGIDPRAMAVTVALAASSSFLTPLEPSCLLVYGPGRYRFFDFMRLGAGLTLLALVVTLALVPRFWPLAP